MNPHAGHEMMKRRTLLFLIAGLGVLAPTAAQPAAEAVPRLAEAEAIFDQALGAFEEGDYGMAFRRFRFVYDNYPLHRKTTAATLMAGKALYRDGAYERAATLLDEFRRLYPTSRYLAEADRTARLARQALAEGRQPPVNLGIALPLDSDDAAFTQALFNGIRLAVEAHNRSGARPVRMVFRDTDNTEPGARAAVTELAGGAPAIIGPLYSDEAQAAALAAERAGVVLVAPLATDEGVAAGRRFVFQANPTITSRGTLMARHAVRELGLRRFGIAAEQGNLISERMAEGFQQEALRLGAEVRFFELLPNARAWSELTDRVGVDALGEVEAVYLPVSGRTAHQQIETVLDRLDRANVLPWVLGNSEYHDLPSPQQAATFGVLYTDDFRVDEGSGAVRAFEHNYRAVAGRDPDRLAYVGYDVTRFLLDVISRTDDPAALAEALRTARRYDGLGMRIDFREDNANTALFFLRYQGNGVVLQN